MLRTWAAATIILLAATHTSWGDAKPTILGFSPKMTFDEAKQLATSQGYRDCNIDRTLIDLGPMCAGATLWFAPDEVGTPLVSVVLQLRTTATPQDVVALLSREYGKQLAEVKFPTGAVSHYEAPLDDGSLIRFTPMGRILVLMNEPMVLKAAAQKFARQNGRAN